MYGNRGRRWRGRMVVPVVAAVVLLASSMGPATAASTLGSDISWPQCGQAYPSKPAFGIVGANDGRPYTTNPCLVSEFGWASTSGTVEFYMNTANPGVALGDAFNYGYNAARYAYSYATSRVAAGPGHLWWLDVETGNSWSDDQGANTAVIAGSIAFFRAQGVLIGIYSTRYQWGVITGGASIPSVPNWVPGAQSAAQAPSFCAARRSFTGGPVVMAQFTTDFDYDYLCPGVSLPPPPVRPAPPGLEVGLHNLVAAILLWLKTL
ncbi:MAG: hypothetical protein M3083_22480 [Actinomycetota bacterium]|nr:hypothetical protein [Actinomycetota bacterium]